MSTTNQLKKIYLIRHAESDENRRIESFRRCVQQVSKLAVPTYEDVSTSMELLNVQAQVDCTVSEVGEKQISHMGKFLQEKNFLQEKGIEMVVHSSLLRARQTCEGLLGCVVQRDRPTSKIDDVTTINAKIQPEEHPAGVKRVMESRLLVERTPQEWIPTNHRAFLNRIAYFEKWLGDQPEAVIAIVGHSQFFRTMLNLPYKFDNCEVWEVDFDPSKHDLTIEANCMKGQSTMGNNRKWTDTFKGGAFHIQGAHSSKAPKDVSSAELPAHWAGLRRTHGCQVDPAEG